MTVGELQRQLQICDPDSEVRIYVEYNEESIKYNDGNVLRRIHHRQMNKFLDKVSITVDAVILEGLGE